MESVEIELDEDLSKYKLAPIKYECTVLLNGKVLKKCIN